MSKRERTLKDGGPISLHPIMVVEDRYRGVYSGGVWLAIGAADAIENGSYRAIHVLDRGPGGDDLDAQDFWSAPPAWIAVGQTPDEAVAALLDRADAALGRDLDAKLAEGQADLDAGRRRPLDDVKRALLAKLGPAASAAE